MVRLEAERLGHPVEEAVRYLALAHLEDAARAHDHLSDPGEPEALHDFRVALRRLRSLERAYRPWFGRSFPRKLRRRLRELAGSTGGGRDAEVHLAWLEGISGYLTEEDTPGLERLRMRLRQKMEGSYQALPGVVGPEFRRIRGELGERLSSYELTVRVDRPLAPPSFLSVTGSLLVKHLGDLGERLAAVGDDSDEKAMHAARIAGKRLRYLLEPLQDTHEEVQERVAELKHLQDILGGLHDFQMLAPVLADALEEAAAERARRLHAVTLATHPAAGNLTDESVAGDVTLGILAVTRVLREERERLFGEVRASWLGGAPGAFFESLRDLSRRFSASRGDDLEIERKYVLAGLPERLKGAEYLILAQGWIPGRRIHERVRKVRSGGGERYYRTLKLGSGMTRTEIEEPMPRTLWRKLWPLTEDLRIRKRRYEVREDTHLWQVDEFLDFDLVLAEVELSDIDEDVNPPGWLAPWIEADVTGVTDYENLTLARKGPPAPRAHRNPGDA